MAEIKSTLELALERSKKFSLSEKEKEEIKKKEIQEKMNSLFYRYQEGHLHLHEIEREIDRMGAETRKIVKEGLLLRWIDALSLEDGNERILKGIEWLKNRPIDEVEGALQRLLHEFQSEREQMVQKVRRQLLEAYRKEGFSGDAIEPNLEASESWRSASGALNQKYQRQLEKFKESLKTL